MRGERDTSENLDLISTALVVADLVPSTINTYFCGVYPFGVQGEEENLENTASTSATPPFNGSASLDFGNLRA
ncbi:hypothetical protein PanWU01x14_136760 [Parasponia andersonii]|uniref:Uncharacterized protein n=1 Tax=Parasponia andersonii TaxID=3476 RepID=A0A2P5CP07_PARAD|nr:hypothetical protein PanWU01x14_136760 [Parasponia andersonii]